MMEPQHASTSGRSFKSFADFHARSDLSRFPRVHRACGSESLQLIKTERSASEVRLPAVPELIVGLLLDGDVPFRFDLGNGWAADHRLQEGDIRLCLPNTEARYECLDDYSLLLICFPLSMVDSLLQEEPTVGLKDFEPLHAQAAFRDEAVLALARQIWSESDGGRVASNLMVDGLAQSLLAQLLRRAEAPFLFGDTRPQDDRIARAVDYAEAHLDEALTLAELAAIACLSAGHFSRSFKATVGEPVWAYVQRRRVERAMEMLQYTDLPIAEIAYRCGFAHQGHLTSCFKRQFGLTPGAARVS